MTLVMPLFALIIVLFGLVRRVPVFDVFLEGAKDGLQTLYHIAPAIMGLMFAVSLLRASGAMEALCQMITPLADAIGFPAEIVPMALLRPVSGSGATALLLSVFSDCGPDSFAGITAASASNLRGTRFLRRLPRTSPLW